MWTGNDISFYFLSIINYKHSFLLTIPNEYLSEIELLQMYPDTSDLLFHLQQDMKITYESSHIT